MKTKNCKLCGAEFQVSNKNNHYINCDVCRSKNLNRSDMYRLEFRDRRLLINKNLKHLEVTYCDGKFRLNFKNVKVLGKFRDIEYLHEYRLFIQETIEKLNEEYEHIKNLEELSISGKIIEGNDLTYKEVRV